MYKICLLLSLLWVQVYSLQSKTIEVCNSCDYQFPAQAVASAAAFDTVVVRSGHYQCVDLKLDRPVTLLGEEGTIIDGNQKGYIFIIKSDSVTVSGFELIGAGRSYTKDFAAIYVDRARYFSITDNVIKDPFFGILVEKSHEGVITSNKVSGHSMREDDSGNGIHLWHCSNILVS